MLKFLDRHNVLFEHQYGFRPKHNTTQPIIQLLHQIAEANDKPSNDRMLAIFLDRSKAFYSVKHKILMEQLQCYGFRGIFNSCLMCYLSNRQQFVQLKYCETMNNLKNAAYDSQELIMECVVPHGSIIGPLIFL